MPSVPVVPDGDGGFKPIMDLGQVRTAVGQENTAKLGAVRQQANDRHREYMAETRLLDAEKPDPLTAPPGAMESWQQSKRDLHARFYPPQPGQQPPAQTSYQDGASAEHAFKAGRIQPEQPVTVRGVKIVFDKDGKPRRAD